MKLSTLLLLFILPFASRAVTVRLMWDRNPEPDVVEYRVYVGTVSRVYSVASSAGNNVEYAVTNLTPGGTYYFAVTAVNTAGLESDYSNEVVYTVPTRPSAPRNPRAVLDTAGIDWRGRTNNNGTVTPVLIVPADIGVAVKATITTPAGVTTRTVTVGTSGIAEFAGKPTARPFNVLGDITQISVDPDVIATVRFE